MQIVTTLIAKWLELRRNKSLSRSELEQLQLDKFHTLVRYVYRNSPYYRRIIDERGIDPAGCRPTDFPVLTKTLLLENFDEIVTDRRLTLRSIKDFLETSTDFNELFLNQYRVLHTSGSTGEVGYFVYSKKDWARGILQLTRQLKRSNRRSPWRRRRVAYFGAIDGHYAGVSMIGMAGFGAVRLLFRLSLNEVNSPLDNVVSNLNEFQPEILSGYTTALKFLAEKQLQGALRIAPLLVSGGGEPMSETDRNLLARAFNCEVKNSYGSSECLVCGASVLNGSAMQIFDDDLIFEFHDTHSEITNLFNFTLPLIRYKTGDVFRSSSGSALSGPYPIIDSVIGRSELVPIFRNESGNMDFLSPFTIIEFFVPGVRQFQMRLQDPECFKFLVRLEDGIDGENVGRAVAATQRRLSEILSQKGMTNVSFAIQVVDELPVSEITGKFQLIVDEQGKRVAKSEPGIRVMK